MFGKQEDPSRTEQATPKQRNKQREKGNVARSQETSKAVSLIAGLIGLYMWVGVMAEEIKKIFRYFLAHSHEFEVSMQSTYELAIWTSAQLALILMPFLLFLAFCIWLSIRLQVGKLWTTQVFKFKWDRFNLIKGLKNMLISPQTVLRLIKSIVLAAVVAIVPAIILRQEYVNFLPMFHATTEGVAVYMLEAGFRMVAYTLIPLCAIAGFDLWQTRFAYNEGMKMTKSEVKDERKQSEGDPVIKQKQREKMMAQLMQRMLQDVPRADVVVTNPTHIAVALRYDVTEAPAPVVLAMGADHLAEKIKAIAREHNIPIRENVPLARALYKSVEVGDMIPEELYKATASILASIWRMKGKTPGR